MGHERKNLCNFVGTWLKGIDKLRAIRIFGFHTFAFGGNLMFRTFFLWAFAM